jgi:aspartyl-tRNA synthetase
MAMERTFTRGLKKGQKVLVQGWVEKTRDLGGLKFFMLRDREGLVQVTAKKGKSADKIVEMIPKMNREDCLTVTGTVHSSTQAPGGLEIVPDSIDVVSTAKTPLPLDISGKIESGKDKRFNYRFLDMRNPKVQAMFRIRDIVLTKMREYFEGKDFVEVHTPVIQAAGAEGGATLFPLIYYQKEAFLRQSPQLYKQMLMSSGLDRVYEIGPAFRAEKFHTRRHVSEFISVDFEQAWIESDEDIMKTLEGMVHYVMKEAKKDCKTELEILGAKINVPELPFKRLTYSDVLDILNKEGKFKLKFGDDVGDPEEALLGKIMEKKGHEWYFITRFPSKIKPFYIMMDGKESMGIDLDYKGMEMASGGQREHRLKELVSVMKSKGMDPEKFKFYLDSFTYGMPSHGGIGFGVERMVQQMVGAENIKEIILFPRTPERLVP